MRISFVGGGVMAEAIVGGILDAKISTAKNIRVGEPVEERRAQLAERYGLDVQARNLDVLKGADLVILSVKPQSLPEVMAELSSGLNSRHAVLSIVAGARMDTLVKGLKHSAVIRVMPNTPAQIGAGMSVWTASEAVPAEKVSASRDILRTLGDELYVEDEKLVDMATALSASGPAYVFLFIEALIDAGVHLGMQRDMARQLVLQTVAGRHQAGPGVRTAPRRAQRHGHLAGRDHRRGSAGLRAGRISGRHTRCSGRRVREGQGPGRAGLNVLLITFIELLFTVFYFAILGRVIMSWVSPKGDDPISPLLYQITEPILKPIRQVVPPLGMFDLTPMIALILLTVIQGILFRAL